MGAAAGDGRSAGHDTDPDTVTDTQRGHQADSPQQIPPKGWKDIAKRTAKEVKADQVPLLSAGVAFYALLALLLTLGAMVLMGVALATIIGYPPIADTLPTAPRWLVAIVRFVILGGLLVVGLAVLYRYAPTATSPGGPG